MNRVVQLALVQTVLFVGIIFFFYVAAFGVNLMLGGGEISAATHLFWVASLVAMASTVHVLLRSDRPLYSRLAIASSLVAAVAVLLQGIAPLLAVMPTASALAVVAFQRLRQRA